MASASSYSPARITRSTRRWSGLSCRSSVASEADTGSPWLAMPNPRAGKRPDGRAQPDLGDGLAGCGGPRSGPADVQLLVDDLTVAAVERKAQRQRRGVRLEVGVGPVAMVLQLEQVAVEPHHRLGALDDADGELRIRLEHARERAVNDALRVDGLRQHALERAAGGGRTVAPSDRAGQGVMDVEADLAVLEDALAAAVHGVADGAIGRALDDPEPLEPDVLVTMAGREGDPEPVAVDGVDPVPVHGRDGVPGSVANGDVGSLHQLHVAEAHVPQVRAVERGRDRSGAEGQRRLRAGPPGRSTARPEIAARSARPSQCS